MNDATGDHLHPAGEDFLYRGHDGAQITAAVQAWARAQGGDLAQATVDGLHHPSHDGFSNITLVFTVHVPGADDRRIVVRLLNENASYGGMSLRQQFDDQVKLRAGGILAPEMLWYGGEDPVLGPERYAMAFAAGDVPSDLPSYHAEGWMTELSEGDREALWWSALDQVVALHRLDPTDAGFADRMPSGTADDLLDAMLADRRTFVDRFAGPDDLAVVRQALAWLEDHRPAMDGPLRLCWGDARLPNMVFQGPRCVAALDWEDLHVGWPELDLAWFVYMDQASAAQSQVPRLAGLPDADATVARWCEGTGLQPAALEWSTVYGAVEMASGFAQAFSSFVPEDQRADTLREIEGGPIFADLGDRIA